MDRIAVTGTSGSGKSTFARRLGARLGVPHIELDALHWEAGWTEADPAVFRARVTDAIAGERWVVDGNYSGVRDLYLARVDTIVWLDLPLRVCLWRVATRTVRRARTRENLWGTGNFETWGRHLGRDSLLWWVITTHGRRRHENEARFAELSAAGVHVLRFRVAGQAEAWLSSFGLDSRAESLPR